MYQRTEKGKNLYEISGPDGEILKNHNSKPYPLLSDKISKVLVDDLNDIGGKQPNTSLAYSLLSTMMGAQEAGMTEYDLRVDLLIQWDRLFRFNPGPPLVLTEFKHTQKAREFLNDNWVNIALNYCSSPEEMKETGCEYVPDETVSVIEGLFAKMNFAEQFTADLLWDLSQNVSIVLPIFWASKIITDEELIGGTWALNQGIDIDELDEPEKESMERFKRRLAFLRGILDGYRDGDQTLPSV